jgi:riboflavin kinase / FMN adenylyltransferase
VSPDPVVVARQLDEVDPAPSVVTIGNFDGVHRGHQVLLRRAVHAAHDAGVRAVAVTFHPHPAAVLRPGSEPPALQPLDERIAGLAEAGVDLVLVLAFTAELAALSAEAFVSRVLVDRLRATRVIVGTNFRFGHRAAGDVVTLVELGGPAGFTTEAVTLLEEEGAAISSSTIRGQLAAGEVDWVAGALGRPFTLTGEVVAGDGRGRTIGVPTANLAVPGGLQLPADGVYAGWAEAGLLRAPAITNVGVRPTFAGGDRSVEVHLLDATADLYGETLTVSFEHRIRAEQRFDGVDALVAQIRDDIASARALLGA